MSEDLALEREWHYGIGHFHAQNCSAVKTRLFGLHFCGRLYGSSFDHFDVIGPKATEFGDITYNKGYYAIKPFKVIQGHLRRYQSKARMRLPINHYITLHCITL